MNTLKNQLPGLLCAVQAQESGSFSAAAQVLGLTPAAVSKNVASLESQLQVRLFNRTTRRLAITEEGQAVLEQARRALEALTEVGSLAARNAPPQGLVRISSASGFGRRFVLPLLPSFFQAYPQIRVELALNDQHVDLLQEGFDVGIRGGSQPPDGMVARKIGGISSVLGATPQYLQAKGTPRALADLAHHRLIRVRFLSGRSQPWVFKTGRNVSALDLPAQLSLSDPDAVLDAALLHMGIALIGRHHAYAALLRGDLVHVLPRQILPTDESMALFYPHRRHLAPRVRVLVDHLLAGFESTEALKTLATVLPGKAALSRNSASHNQLRSGSSASSERTHK